MNQTGEFEKIMVKLEKIEAMLIKLTEKKDALKNNGLMDNSDMCLLLGVTKRTLQRYRQKGVVPYYKMNGKAYYMPEEVKESLKRIMKVSTNPKKP